MSLFEEQLQESSEIYLSGPETPEGQEEDLQGFSKIYEFYAQTGSLRRPAKAPELLKEDDPLEWLPAEYRPSKGGNPGDAPEDAKKEAIENFCVNNPDDERCKGGRTMDPFKSAHAGDQSTGAIGLEPMELPGAVGADQPAPAAPATAPAPAPAAATAAEEPSDFTAYPGQNSPSGEEEPAASGEAPAVDSDQRREFDLSAGDDFYGRKSHMLSGGEKKEGSGAFEKMTGALGAGLRGGWEGYKKMSGAAGDTMRAAGRGAGSVARGVGNVARGVANTPRRIGQAYRDLDDWAARKERETKQYGAFGALPSGREGGPKSPADNRRDKDRKDWGYSQWEAQQNGDPQFRFNGKWYKTKGTSGSPEPIS